MTERIAEASPRRSARITGVVYLFYFLTAVSAEAFVGRGRLVAYVAVNLIAYAFYIAVTLLFYYMFEPVNRRLSLLAAFLSLVGCANDVLSLLNLAPYRISSLIFFGPYCLLLGYLIFRSTFLPRILGVLMAFAGLGWLLFLSPLENRLSTYLRRGTIALPVAPRDESLEDSPDGWSEACVDYILAEESLGGCGTRLPDTPSLWRSGVNHSRNGADIPLRRLLPRSAQAVAKVNAVRRTGPNLHTTCHEKPMRLDDYARRLAHISGSSIPTGPSTGRSRLTSPNAAPHAIEVERSRIATKGWEPSCSPTTGKMGGPDRGLLIGM